MNTILDEQALRERLHRDLDTLPAAPAPVRAVIQRGVARRARRRAAAAAGLAAAAAAAVAAGTLLPGSGRPGPAGRATAVSRPGLAGRPPAVQQGPAGAVFAAGTASGQAWQLSAGNVADPGARCLPALLLNGTDADLLPTTPPTLGAIDGLAYLTDAPGAPGAGYAALRVAPSVTSLRVRLAGGAALTVRPVTERACGLVLRLAGFSYPAAGVADITAYAGSQKVSAITPAGGLVRSAGAAGAPLPSGGPGPASRLQPLVPGVWQHLWRSTGPLPSGQLGAGRAGSRSWRISVLLGVDGECYTATVYGEAGGSGGLAGAGGLAGSGGPAASGGSSCGPITPPPRTVVLRRVPLAGGSPVAG